MVCSWTGGPFKPDFGLSGAVKSRTGPDRKTEGDDFLTTPHNEHRVVWATPPLLLLTVFVSGLIPARRAAKVEPMVALRCD